MSSASSVPPFLRQTTSSQLRQKPHEDRAIKPNSPLSRKISAKSQVSKVGNHECKKSTKQRRNHYTFLYPTLSSSPKIVTRQSFSSASLTRATESTRDSSRESTPIGITVNSSASSQGDLGNKENGILSNDKKRLEKPPRIKSITKYGPGYSAEPYSRSVCSASPMNKDYYSFTRCRSISPNRVESVSNAERLDALIMIDSKRREDNRMVSVRDGTDEEPTRSISLPVSPIGSSRESVTQRDHEEKLRNLSDPIERFRKSFLIAKTLNGGLHRSYERPTDHHELSLNIKSVRATLEAFPINTDRSTGSKRTSDRQETKKCSNVIEEIKSSSETAGKINSQIIVEDIMKSVTEIMKDQYEREKAIFNKEIERFLSDITEQLKQKMRGDLPVIESLSIVVDNAFIMSGLKVFLIPAIQESIATRIQSIIDEGLMKAAIYIGEDPVIENIRKNENAEDKMSEKYDIKFEWLSKTIIDHLEKYQATLLAEQQNSFQQLTQLCLGQQIRQNNNYTANTNLRTPPRDRPLLGHRISSSSANGRKKVADKPWNRIGCDSIGTVVNYDTPCSWALSDSMALSESHMVIRNKEDVSRFKYDRNNESTQSIFNEDRFQTLLSYESNTDLNNSITESKIRKHWNDELLDRSASEFQLLLRQANMGCISPQSEPNLRRSEELKIKRQLDDSVLDVSASEYKKQEQRHSRIKDHYEESILSSSLITNCSFIGTDSFMNSKLRTIVEVDSSQGSETSQEGKLRKLMRIENHMEDGTPHAIRQNSRLMNEGDTK